MIFEGKDLNYFVNNQSVTKEEIKDLIDYNNATVSVDGLNIHFFTPKKSKWREKFDTLLDECLQLVPVEDFEDTKMFLQSQTIPELEYYLENFKNKYFLKFKKEQNKNDKLNSLRSGLDEFMDKSFHILKEADKYQKQNGVKEIDQSVIERLNDYLKAIDKFQEQNGGRIKNSEFLGDFELPYCGEICVEKKESQIGYKETNGKLDYSEINFEILDLMAKRFMSNKHKYPHGNSKKDINKDDILWAAFRHIRKMIQPIENDPETYEDHLSAIMTNMSIILDQLRK